MSQTFIGTVTGLKSFTEKTTLSNQKEKNECSRCNQNFYEKGEPSKTIIWEIRGVKGKFFCSRKCVGDWLRSNENQEVRAKTVTTKTFSTKLHPKYFKPIRKERDYQVHNEECDLKLGDKVLIKSSRPYSKTKRFIVARKEENRGDKNTKKVKIIISDDVIKYEKHKYSNK